MNIVSIPAELRERPQWVVWRLEHRDGKPTKVPYRADGSGRASSTDATTWASFEAALAAAEALAAEGVGYVFSTDDPFVGIDLDDGLSETERAEILRELDSYTETSFSGNGAHIIVRATLNGHPRNRKGPFEVYEAGRYFVVTGAHIVGTPVTIEDRQAQLDDVLARFLPAQNAETRQIRQPQPVDLDDQTILDRAANFANGADFEALWEGNWNGHPSQSEADLDLCGKLAFVTGADPIRVDRIFRSSGLMRPKWDTQRGDSTYGWQTIAKALEDCTATYSSKVFPAAETPLETPPLSASALPLGNGSEEGVSAFPPLRGETPSAETVPPPRGDFSFSTAEEFAAVVEETAEVILGTDEQAAMVAGGTGITFGDGGAGKSTMELDKAMHLVTGRTWLGLEVPRKLSVLVVENDGPRGPFRKKIKAKLAAWDGPDPEGRLHVLKEPWGEVNIALEEHRQALAAYIREHGIDVLLAGPIVSLGMIGGGTPDEVAAFEEHLRRLRALLDRPLVVWLIHHENMRGQISGAWTRVPDTLAHVTATGPGKTRLFWKKARWSSDLHGATWKLHWAAGESFVLDDAPPTTDEEIADALLAAVQANPGGSWNVVLDAFNVGSGTKKAVVRDELLKAGRLVNRGRPGAFKLWHPDDSALPPAEGALL